MYDLTDLDVSLDERDVQLRELRETDPVAWDDANGWWYVTRHADITSVSRNTDAFTSTHGVTYFAPLDLSMITLDPPEHTRVRRLVSKQFTPRMVNLLRDLARQRAEAGIERMLANGGGDFVEEVAVPMTLGVIMHMLGIGSDRLHDIRTWSDDMMAASGRMHIPDVAAKATVAGGAWAEHLAGHIDQKLADPTDDILSLVGTDPEDALTGEDLHQFALLLIVAGNETTRHTSSFAVKLLAEHLESAAELRADPDLIAAAVQEILRWTSVVRTMSRTATRDVELGGKRIRRGDMVNLIYPSANRDADVFENPFDFDITRDPNPQIAFGIGTHYCLGANLAMLQLSVVLEAWLRMAGPHEITDFGYVHTGVVTGLDRLDISFV